MTDGAPDAGFSRQPEPTPAEKRARLKALLAERAAGARSEPLSAGQERLWALEAINPGNRAYVETGSIRFSANVELRFIQRALDEIVRRHEILRTTFAMEAGRPVQRIAGSLSLPLEVEDLRGVSRDRLDEKLREVSHRPFDLARGPLLRCKLLRVGEKEHIVFVAIHHIVCDGYSIRLLLTELFELYVAARMGQPARLRPPSAQYADYARWQRRWLEGDAVAEQLAYWRRALSPPLALVELPPDRPPRAGARRFRGARHRFRVPDALHTALRKRATELDATPFVLLLAGFDVLLGAYTGERDIAVASPVAGRNRPEFENVMGFFVNTVLLRCDLSGDPSFREIVARARAATLGAMAHQDVPIDIVLRELKEQRSLSRTSLVRTGFALHPAWTDHLEHARGYGVEVLDLDSGASRMELSVMLWQGKTELTGTIEYDTDLYDAATVERFADHYVRLLDGFARDPERCIESDLPLDSNELRNIGRRRERWRARCAVKAPQPDVLPVRDPDVELEALCERTNLTRNQMLVWLGQRAEPDIPLYNIPALFHLDVDIEVESFRRALQALVDASDSLRSVFEEVDGLPRQRVLAHFDVELPVHDFSREPNPDARAKAFVAEHRGVRLEPARPLFETALLVLGPRRSIWYFNQHHLIGDGWSLSLLLKGLGGLYRRDRAGESIKFELPSFEEFQQAERALRGSARWARAQEYWRALLADPPPPLWFYARSLARSTTRVFRSVIPLGRERSAKLMRVARNMGADANTSPNQALYLAVAAAVFAWLHRSSGNRRIAIGSPMLNRSGARRKRTLGLFMHAVPIAIEVARDETLRSLAHKVARALREAMRHQFYATANPPERPFYEVGLNVHVARSAPFDGVRVRTEWRHPGHEHEALAIQVRDFDGTGELALDFDAREDRFDADQARYAARRLIDVFDALIADPDVPVDAIEILDAAERAHLLEELNRTESVRADDVIDAFHRAVDQFPTQVALVDGSEEVTYADLEAHANQLTNHLIERGIEPDDHVALLAARSADYIVGALGILGAGAAYVPIDPAHPRQRIASMIAGSHAKAVLLQRAFENCARELSIVQIALDGPDCAWKSAATQRRAARGCRYGALSGAEARAGYVIFTSGSTGRPHAVVVSAASLAHYAETAARKFELVSSDRVLQFAALSFDTAVEEIFPTLISGATLVLRDDAMIAVPEEFLAHCDARGITLVNLPTSYWNAIVDSSVTEQPTPNAIRLVVVGGERVLPARLAAWRRGPGRGLRLLNGYGPTETTVVATFADLSNDATDGASSPRELFEPAVPIGRPIADARVYILDDQLRPLPKGAVGELWIGGAGVALGYLDEPELTAERFRPDPFGPPGARLYRSGDLCRWQADALEFLGRVDLQVKVGGVRVELAEIEAALIAQEAVRDAAVETFESRGRARLAAWVVPVSGELDGAALRAALRERLPDQMIPAPITAVAALPRFPNGKLDRGALRALGGDGSERCVEPRNARERALASIWCEVLGLERVSVEDDFIALGGDSLLAIHVTLLAQRRGMRFAPRQIFEGRTIAALASAPAVLDETNPSDHTHASSDANARYRLVDFAEAPDAPATARPLFVFHGAGGDLRSYRFLVRELAAAAPVVGIESSLPAGPGTAHDSIGAMARDYRDLLLERQPHGPYRLLGWSMGALIALEVARLLEARGETVEFVGVLDDSASALPAREELSGAALADRIGDLMRASDLGSESLEPFDSDDAAADSLAGLESQAAQLIESFESLSAHERASAAAVWLEQHGLVSPALTTSMLESRLRRFEEHRALCVDAAIAAIGAPVWRWITSDSNDRPPPPALAGAQSEIVSGNHYTMLLPPHVADLAARIRRALERASIAQEAPVASG